MANIGVSGPLGVIPIPSSHGDVHVFQITRSNGDSLTVDDYRAVFRAVTGRDLADGEVAVDAKYFAEEDR